MKRSIADAQVKALSEHALSFALGGKKKALRLISPASGGMLPLPHTASSDFQVER